MHVVLMYVLPTLMECCSLRMLRHILPAVCPTHKDASPVVQSAAIYLAGHRIVEGEANELHAMGPACAGSSQANQLIVDLKHHATNPPPATPQAALASAESAKR